VLRAAILVFMASCISLVGAVARVAWLRGFMIKVRCCSSNDSGAEVDFACPTSPEQVRLMREWLKTMSESRIRRIKGFHGL